MRQGSETSPRGSVGSAMTCGRGFTWCLGGNLGYGWIGSRCDWGIPLDDQTKEALSSSALLIPILSPAFFASKATFKEFEFFVSLAGTKRVVPVSKYPTDGRLSMPETSVHQFYRRTKEGLPQELTGDRYLRALDGLVSQISNELKELMGDSTGLSV
jgi:hypothetical protein